MADVALVLSCRLVVDIDTAAVSHVLLREIEDVAVGIVGGDAGERPRRGPLHPVGLRILGPDAIEHGFHILDLNTEMVEGARPPGLAWVDVEPDIAVTNRNRSVGRSLADRFMPNSDL